MTMDIVHFLEDEAEAWGVFVCARHRPIEGIEGHDVGFELFRVYRPLESVQRLRLGIGQIGHLLQDAQVALESRHVVDFLPCLGAAKESITALADGYITVTPLQFNLTNERLLQEMHGWTWRA